MACRSSQFHLLHVAISEPCRLSEFTLSGPLSNQADIELDMINVISAADISFINNHVKFTSYCELIECSRPIRFLIVSLKYNNYN